MTEASPLPAGTVTFLFTDIEGSTRLVRRLGPGWQRVLEEHNGLLREAIREAGGVDLRTEGDSVFAVFDSAPAAVSAAAAAQRAIASAPWPEPVRVRMGLHTGEGVPGGDDYVGLDVHLAARIAAAGHGGQILLSGATRALVEHALPTGVTLRGLGRHRLKDLPRSEELHQLVMEGLPSEFPPPRTLQVPTNLPMPLTSFVGRERELIRIRDLLEQTRLLTLTGAGGSGKTRLAIEAAGRQQPSYADGVFFVELATITDPGLVPSTIAVALGVREEPTRPVQESLKDALRDREILLVLDNFEQILGAAPFITELLRGAPRLRVLVTSRGALHLSGEQELPVPPLRMPGTEDRLPAERLMEFEAVALFAQRSAAMAPDFAITEENAVAVAEICARLDGLPLAIELAASRIKLLSPSAMLDRLHHRLAVLTGGPQDLPARQRTLRATIGWSYDLLNQAERMLCSRLATFVGGWTIEAAEAVANPDGELKLDMLDALGSLVDKSLIRNEPGAGDARFGMLETIREFGLDALEGAGEAALVRRRHASYFLALAEAAGPELTVRERGWLDRLEREHDNLRAALRWTIDSGEADGGLRMAGALWRFWLMRDHLAEGRRWTNELLGLPAAAARTAARAKALSAAGSLAYWLRDTESVQDPYEESLAIFREIGDVRGEAEGSYNLAFAHLLRGDLPAARELHERAADIYRTLGDEINLAFALTALAMAAARQGDLLASRALNDEAGRTFRGVGHLWGIVQTSGLAASLALKEKDYDRARPAAIEMLDANEALGHKLGISVSIQAVALLAIHEGRPEVGVTLAGSMDRIREVAGGEAPPSMVGLEDPRQAAHALLAEDRIAELWDQGRAMSLDEALVLARHEADRLR